MNKRQFFTNSAFSELNPNNIRRHKFSNFTTGDQNIFNAASASHQPSTFDQESKNANKNQKNNRSSNLSNAEKIKGKAVADQMPSNKETEQVAKIEEQQQKNKNIEKVPINKNNMRISALNSVSNTNEVDNKGNNASNGFNKRGQKSPVYRHERSPENHASRKPFQTVKIQEKCAVCQTPTQKCCSLCRKVFYCSSEHQEIDWHTRHKVSCESRLNTVNATANQQNESNKFVFYSNTQTDAKLPNESLQRELEYQTIHRFLELLEQRLVLRAKIMGQVLKINERTPLIVRESLVRQAQELVQLSTKITYQEYKPWFERKISRQDIMEYSSQQWGSEVVINQTGILLEYLADVVLLTKMYHICGMSREARQHVILLGKQLQDPDKSQLFYPRIIKNSQVVKRSSSADMNQNQTAVFHNGGVQSTLLQDHHTVARSLLLSSIIQLSEQYNVDKTTESAFKLFTKRVEQTEGVWEQIYAYFNVGVWYLSKTYYDKAIKSFVYALELLDGHKKGLPQANILKADCHFNVGCCYWACKDASLAIENMQECYRIRINSIGKNSMECTYCLVKLAKWYQEVGKWAECLQYLDECHRIRKLYQTQPIHQAKLQQIKTLIANAYEAIKREKKRGEKQLDPNAQRYYSQLLERDQTQQSRLESRHLQESEQLDRATVASRLFRDDKQYVKFKVVISGELFSTLSSQQAHLLSELLDYEQEKIEKSEAVKRLVQNKFVSSLNSEQRELFFHQNQLDKSQPRS